ncbi:MAG: protein disulfide oxidoreductase [Pseudomonadota bacterium]
MPRFWPIAVQGIVILAIIAGVNLWRTRDMVSGAAPSLAAVTLDGEHFDLKTFSGKPLFVHFWAEWCPICAFEEETIQSLSEEYELISVALSSGNDETLRNYMRESGLDFQVINDGDGQFAADWGVMAVPATFVIDAAGEIRFTEMGYSSKIGLVFRHWIASAFP